MLSATVVVSSVLILASLSGSWANCPNGILQQGISGDERNVIVNEHNNFRIRIANGKVGGQPRGVNLKRMSWDDCLAREAQRIANSCNFGHQTASCQGFSHVGQNLYISKSTSAGGGSDWRGAIASWTNEHSVYKFGSGFSGATGHYTQVVWADTNRIGCGFTYFRANDQFAFQKLYVCNYGPAGNYLGQKPYRTGGSGCENLC